MTDSSSGESSSTRLDPNLAAALAYLAGPLTGVVFILAEKQSSFVRFHAWQSTIVFVMIWVVVLLMLQVPVVGWFAALVVAPPVVFILWLVLLVKAYQGERLKLPIAGPLAERYGGGARSEF